MGAKMSPKRFKQYDKLYQHLRNTFYSQEADEKLIRVFAEDRLTWPYGYNQPSPDDVRDAVYLCNTAHEWQAFRVSLKGQTTKMKVARLIWRYVHNISTHHHESAEFKREVVRINNYIGALIRGGQLNVNLEIVR